MAKKLTKAKAREILHDKEVHGHPLTDKQRRFFGAIASAQNGIEGTMGGLTNVGFNYNPAWGGAWENGGILKPAMAGANQIVPMYAMGGNLPGMTGMMYERIGAPSNGPRGKKTLASAQNGQEMQYYQQGFDFQPKTISKNGGWLDKYDDDELPIAQGGIDLIPGYGKQYLSGNQGDMSAAFNIPTAEKLKQQKAIEEYNRQQKVYNDFYAGREYVGPAQQRTQAEEQKAQEFKRKKAEEYVATHPEKKVTSSGDLTLSPYGEFVQKYGNNMDKLAEGLGGTANYVLGLPMRAIQSAYKSNYTLKDALTGQASDSSILEDFATDPLNWLTLGGKGSLMAAMPLVKRVAGVGEVAQDLNRVGEATQDINRIGEVAQNMNRVGEAAKTTAIAPSATQNLPLYSYFEGDDASKLAFQEEVDKLKTQLSTPQARQKFEQLGEVLTNNTNIMNIDPAYTEALFNKNLPIQAVDKYASSIISTDAAANRLTKEQLKYLQNLGTLTTDVDNLQRYFRYTSHGGGNSAINQEDIAKFIIDNSKNISPRHLTSLIHNLDIPQGAKERFVKQLMEAYSGQPIKNPIADITGATDLLTYVDNQMSTLSPGLSSKIRASLRNIMELGEQARPKVTITGDFFDPMAENSMTHEAISYIKRNEVPNIPTAQERQRLALTAGRQTMNQVNDVLNNPENKGKIFVASHSLSTDSHPLGLQLLARHKNLGEFLPIHGGSVEKVIPPMGFNPMSGLSAFSSKNINYLQGLEAKIKHKLTNIPASDIPSNAITTASGLQNQFLLSGLSNSAIDDFNKMIGTNIPSSYFSASEREFLRPNIGIKLHKKGGVVKDNMGYWNPQNWGKVVEIDGGDITMQGVDQPLLGISDTGDVQYMEPGKNYKFKGKKVKEYPVGARGVSVNKADEYPLKKLDDLLNFTNYNKKAKSGGWLNKYQ